MAASAHHSAEIGHVGVRVGLLRDGAQQQRVAREALHRHDEQVGELLAAALRLCLAPLRACNNTITLYSIT